MSVLNRPSELTHAITKSLNITRDGSVKAMCEFNENDKLFYGTFPFIFVLGKGMANNGSCPVLFRQMILRQYDNRASRNSKFNFIMFNQSQRHAAISTIAARAKSNPKSMLRFLSIVNADGYMDRLQAAVKIPNSPEANKLQRVNAVNSCFRQKCSIWCIGACEDVVSFKRLHRIFWSTDLVHHNITC
jgi:hypothetical protein